MEIKCSSCKKSVANVTGTVNFKCPACSKEEIVRCLSCRKNVVKYVCSACGFEGPN